jgi:hypothetical protein
LLCPSTIETGQGKKRAKITLDFALCLMIYIESVFCCEEFNALNEPAAFGKAVFGCLSLPAYAFGPSTSDREVVAAPFLPARSL